MRDLLVKTHVRMKDWETCEDSCFALARPYSPHRACGHVGSCISRCSGSCWIGLPYSVTNYTRVVPTHVSGGGIWASAVIATSVQQKFSMCGGTSCMSVILLFASVRQTSVLHLRVSLSHCWVLIPVQECKFNTICH